MLHNLQCALAKTNQVNVSGTLVLLGEFATSFFSALMGVIGSAKLLQALARDHLIPGLSLFGQGTKSRDEPTYAIIITYAIAQISMLSDINALASFGKYIRITKREIYLTQFSHDDLPDDIPCHQFGMFPAQDRLGSKF